MSALSADAMIDSDAGTAPSSSTSLLTQSRLQRTFLLLSSSSVLALVSLLLYFNYQLLAPHLAPLFWAVLVSQALHRPRQVVFALLTQFDRALAGRHKHVAAAVFAACAALAAAAPSALTVGLAAALASLTALALFGDRRHVSALLLVTLVALLIACPCYFFLSAALRESHEFIHRARTFLTSNPELDQLLGDFPRSPAYAAMVRAAASVGVEQASLDALLDVESIKAKLLLVLTGLTDQLTTILASTLSILANLSNFLLQLLSFLSFLFVLLESEAGVGATVARLSPFGAAENQWISREVRQTAQSIFVCSATG